MQNTEYVQWISLLPGIGSRKGKELLRQFETPQIIYENRKSIFTDDKTLINTDLIYDKARVIIENALKANISVIGYGDDEYCSEWKEFPDFPLIIYKKGNASLYNYQGIGIVGARRCTSRGKEIAIQTAKNAIEAKKFVVSGMAKGIDGYAHTSAIKNGGKTIAVLGCGADICYPIEHRYLYEAICENGAIISEYPPGTKVRKYYFPNRNRIIAAMSDELYVIDATENSGTRTTVEAAIRYGKDIIRLP